MASVEIDLTKFNIQSIISELNQIPDEQTLIAISNTLAKRCDPYVPFLNGPLSQTHEVTAEGVRYIQPYARYQYYGDSFNHTLDYHPLASARWDEAMLRDHKEDFEKEITKIIEWRLQQLNGND